MAEPFLNVNPGLCDRCRWMRRIESSRGSQFALCERSLTDPRFRRYPILPVLDCQGFDPVDSGEPRSTIS